MRASADSFPGRVTRTSRAPFLFMVPPQTREPGAFSTGRLSPVSSDSSTVERPETTSPSVPICSPGRTRAKSPTATSLSGTETSWPARSSRTVLGAKRIRRTTASLVLPRARASMRRPRVTKITSPDTASHCVWRAAAGKVSGKKTT